MNNTTKNIKFTKEEEHDNKLAFLDVLLTKTDDGKLNTQVYRKNTHTDQLLNYNSNHPTQHKISCIRTLFNRIDTHCNTEQSKQEERKYICTLLSTKMTIPDILSTRYYHAKNRQTWNSPRKQRQESLYPTYTQHRKWHLDYFDHSTLTLRINRQTSLDLILPNTRTKHLQQTNTTLSICLVVQIAQKNILDKHLKRYRRG